MQCVFCYEIIDADSFYCDMCGEEIKNCPGCKKPGKGKNCTTCGTPLTTIKSQAGMSSVASGTNAVAQSLLHAGGIAPEPISSALGARRFQDNERPVTTVPQLRLLNKTVNIDLSIDDNTIVGRDNGQYVTTFGKFDRVSGIHCRFNYDPTQGWCVTDLGSRHKTKYNNQELKPNTPQVINDQSHLHIANIEFFVRVIPG